jgi:N-acetylglucosamine-6-phosphate deacetylase
MAMATSGSIVNRFQGKHITAMALPKRIETEVVDANRNVAYPGFIDIQMHSITPLMVNGHSLSKIK